MKPHEHTLSKDCPCKPEVEDYRLTEADAAFQKPVPLIEELRIEAALVPHRRGELYSLAAERISALENALHRVIDAKDAGAARRIAVDAVGVPAE